VNKQESEHIGDRIIQIPKQLLMLWIPSDKERIETSKQELELMW